MVPRPQARGAAAATPAHHCVGGAVVGGREGEGQAGFTAAGGLGVWARRRGRAGTDGEKRRSTRAAKEEGGGGAAAAAPNYGRTPAQHRGAGPRGVPSDARVQRGAQHAFDVGCGGGRGSGGGAGKECASKRVRQAVGTAWGAHGKDPCIPMPCILAVTPSPKTSAACPHLTLQRRPAPHALPHPHHAPPAPLPRPDRARRESAWSSPAGGVG